MDLCGDGQHPAIVGSSLSTVVSTIPGILGETPEVSTHELFDKTSLLHRECDNKLYQALTSPLSMASHAEYVTFLVTVTKC